MGSWPILHDGSHRQPGSHDEGLAWLIKPTASMGRTSTGCRRVTRIDPGSGWRSIRPDSVRKSEVLKQAGINIQAIKETLEIFINRFPFPNIRNPDSWPKHQNQKSSSWTRIQTSNDWPAGNCQNGDRRQKSSRPGPRPRQIAGNTGHSWLEGQVSTLKQKNLLRISQHTSNYFTAKHKPSSLRQL